MRRILVFFFTLLIVGCEGGNQTPSNENLPSKEEESCNLGNSDEKPPHVRPEDWYYLNKTHGCCLAIMSPTHTFKFDAFTIVGSRSMNYDDKTCKWGPFEIGVNFYGGADYDENYFPSVLDIITYMDQQLEENGILTGQYNYYDDYLIECSIKSSVPLFGKDSYEELTDCFRIRTSDPMFSCPDGTLLSLGSDYEVKDWIAAQCFIPSSIYFYPKDEYLKNSHAGEVTFELKLVTSKGFTVNNTIVQVFK